ncbi:unnamed protein product [Enterobius vermicularis]|uniref:6-pyruvoyltetrahydropterin synthase n=1 Tax=Enterobius vermicularis TaxID=51028 RepID=A0A0N4VN81_ENTVE|nr:unnamed protein product [Enterobius vermicularis]
MVGFVEITRVEEFSAAHRLHSKFLSEEENQKLYGKCNGATCHGHNYKLKVTIRNVPDSETGMAYNLCKLKTEIGVILEQLDHKNLTYDVEYFKDHVSTTENLAIYVWNELKKIMSFPELLWKVCIKETSKNSFAYFGP